MQSWKPQKGRKIINWPQDFQVITVLLARIVSCCLLENAFQTNEKEKVYTE